MEQARFRYEAQFTAEEQARHAALLAEIQRADDVRIAAVPEGPDRWLVAVAAADRIGLLSMFSGLLTARGCDISRALLFTLPPRRAADSGAVRPGAEERAGAAFSSDRSRKVLDVFHVAVRRECEEADPWARFARELADLIGKAASGQLELAREMLIDEICQTIKSESPMQAGLLPVAIEFDNETEEDATGLKIVSQDMRGFLFAFANALALLGINIDRAEIETVGGEARDTFWIQDTRGQKITGEAKLRQLRAACALIKQFVYLLPASSNPGQAMRQFGALVGQVLDGASWHGDFEEMRSGEVLTTLAELMGVSQFWWEDFLRLQHENLFPCIADAAQLHVGPSKEELERRLAADLRAVADFDVRAAVVNTFKDREMFRADLRHITRRIDDRAFGEELSDVGEVVVAAVFGLCHRQLRERHGSPRLADGAPCRSCVLAAGKFGGREMGFASDIELLFVYAGQGQSDGERVLDNAEYFENLVRLFLRTLRARKEGIFEVDLRLRPYGEKGVLASALDAFAGYYSPEGPAQQFERMALVKLRPVAGDGALAERVLAVRDRFTYSSLPIDYEAIRHLRRRQATELVRPGALHAKYSPGGLVDLEYFIQARQIECGAGRPEVRVANTLEAVSRLEAIGAIDAALSADLRRAYLFLRRVIDALRVVRGNAKDLTVPEPDSRAFTYLARRLGFADTECLGRELDWSMALGRRLWT